MLVVHSLPHNGNGSGLLLEAVLPSLLVALGVGWRATLRFRRWMAKRQHFWNLMFGVPEEPGMPGSGHPGILTQFQTLLTNWNEDHNRLDLVEKKAEKGVRIGIAAHKRMDRAGMSPTWGRTPPKEKS